MSKPGPKKAENTYLFAQQRDASCMLMPFINYAVLAQQVDKKGGMRYLDREWHTKEEWFLQTFPALRDWYLTMNRLSFPKPGENNAFAIAQEDVLLNGLRLEEIELLLNKDETLYVESDGTEDVLKMLLMPYTSSDKNKAAMMSKYVPIYYDQGKFYCYDPQAKKHIELQAKAIAYKNMKDGIIIKYADLNVPAHLKSYYMLNDDDHLHASGPAFGREQMMKAYYIDPDYKTFSGPNKTGYFYGSGLYSMMLFAMGLDEKNNPITPTSEYGPAYQNYKEVMAKFPNNPWNSPHFKRENLLEYHMAEVLKANPELKKRMKAHLNQFTSWPYYEALGQLKNGEDYREYLAGEDQMMAFAISGYLKLLWAASLSKEKLLAVTELGTLSKELAEGLDTDQLMGEMVAGATKKDRHNRDFLDYWEEMKSKVVARVGDKMPNLVSFDGHGSIKSFNPSICAAQAKEGLANEALYKRLGYTEIDSFYQEGKQPFYQRTVEEAARMEKAAKTLQNAWRKRKEAKTKEEKKKQHQEAAKVAMPPPSITVGGRTIKIADLQAKAEGRQPAKAEKPPVGGRQLPVIPAKKATQEQKSEPRPVKLDDPKAVLKRKGKGGLIQ